MFWIPTKLLCFSLCLDAETERALSAWREGWDKDTDLVQRFFTKEGKNKIRKVHVFYILLIDVENTDS